MPPEADYRVDLSVYRGPLDLLLYLIREREMDIHDIPIAEITEQFLAHLEVVKRIDIDLAGDFLLMAATLMLIKSRMLLPRPEEQEEDAEDDLDPRTDLVRQLLEYKRFRDISRGLGEAEALRARRFESGLLPPPPDAPDAGRMLADLGVNDLFLAYERMMRETLAEVDHRIFGETLPMRDVQAEVLRRLADAGGRMLFRDLFLERRDRFYIVSIFVSLLEMLRARRVAVEAGENIVDLAIALLEPPAAPQNRLP